MIPFNKIYFKGVYKIFSFGLMVYKGRNNFYFILPFFIEK